MPPALLVVGEAVKTDVNICVVWGASVVWAMTVEPSVAPGEDDADMTETGSVETDVATEVVSTVTALLFEDVTPCKFVLVMTG